MHSFGVLSVLELRIDQIARLGRAFSMQRVSRRDSLSTAWWGKSVRPYLFKLQIVFPCKIPLTGRTNHSRTTSAIES
jgi:hypothetical protein